MNPTFIKALLISSLAMIAIQESNAEQLPNLNIQPPVWGGQGWNMNQVPIAWGDCVPVPVVPIQFGPNHMPMVSAPQPMMAYPSPMNMPSITPPPSPFFDSVPAPVPVIANIAPPVCDNSKLNALQTRYNQGAAASKRKIEEISQALNDSNLQMTDATLIIEKLTKESAGITDENTALKKQLLDLSNTNISLKGKLATIESNVGDQARKITVLNQSAAELVALQSAYKARNDENAALKKQLAELDDAFKTLKAKFSTTQTEAGSQARKLTLLNQTSLELTALKSAYKERNAESAELKIKLGKMENAYKSLQAKLTIAQADAEAQARKLTALGQSSIELTAAKSAYKARSDENAALKKKLADLDGAYKSLQAKFALATEDASSQARKITVLGQSAKELTATQSAYKAKLNENISLKAALTSCKEKESSCSMNLTNIDNKRKSLLSQITDLEKNVADQARKITSFSGMASELTALKSAYKDLGAKLAEATADTDKDGVLNNADKCPNSPLNSEVNLVGCPADTDNDGVVDSKDECPTSPINSVVNEKGCPKIADADGDSIADVSDLCPSTPSGAAVNEFGCEPTQNITLDGVNFATGSARLTEGSFPILSAAAITLNNNPTLKIEVSGYTDNQGGRSINRQLSQRRANSVMIQLIKEGVTANRLIAKGYGELNPVATNDTAEGRATNRRVELKIRK